MRCPVLPPDPFPLDDQARTQAQEQWNQMSHAEQEAIQKALTPLTIVFNALFTRKVKQDPEIQKLIQADEPLVCFWGDGSVSIAADAVPGFFHGHCAGDHSPHKRKRV